jgi:hypothetical protein
MDNDILNINDDQHEQNDGNESFIEEHYQELSEKEDKDPEEED